MITYVSILAILLSSRNEVWAVLILGELDEPTLIADIVSGSRFDGQNTTRTATSFDIGNETMNSTSTRDNSTRDGSKLGLPLEGHPGITDSARKEVEDKISEIFNDTIANASHIPVANVNQSEAVDPSAAKDIATRTEVTVENSVRSAMKEKSKEIDEQIHHIDEEIKRINETEGILDGTISSVENSARKREEVSEKKKQLERGKKHAEKKKKRLEAEVERELKYMESDISQEEKKEDAHFKPKSGKQRKKHDGKTTTEESADRGDHDDELNFSGGVFSKATDGSNRTGNYSNASGEDKVAREIGNRIANAINRTMKKAKRDHRNVTVEELHHVAIDELDRMWHILENAKRHKHSEAGDYGFDTFIDSVPFFDWMLLIMATCLSLIVYSLILEWPSSSSMHGFALLIWFAGGATYNALIFGRQGMNAGIVWMSGYFLECIFMVENVFVFHIIVQAFSLPRMVTQRVLFAVVAIQVLLQMLFYMGLASILRSCQSLPYILGPWLIYCGYQASVEDLDHSYDIMNTRFMIYLQRVMGDRLCNVEQGINSGTFFVLKDEKWAVSMAGLATVGLLVADFFLEIDVSVTKIESMQDQYLAFSSSVVASFALPELFFVARDFFRRFAGLKFGVGFVLAFFGFQMLMHRFFSFTALANMAIITAAVTCSVFFSVVCNCGERVDSPSSDPPQTSTSSITGVRRLNATFP